MSTLTYEDRIRRERPNMSKSFAKLGDFLLDSYVEAAFMTASELAHALKIWMQLLSFVFLSIWVTQASRNCSGNSPEGQG